MFRQGCGFFLYYLLNQNGVSHLGRPKGKRALEYSLVPVGEHLACWGSEYGQWNAVFGYEWVARG